MHLSYKLIRPSSSNCYKPKGTTIIDNIQKVIEYAHKQIIDITTGGKGEWLRGNSFN